VLDPDELAGVVDLFGALTRAELDRARAELAYRRGEDPPATPAHPDADGAAASPSTGSGDGPVDRAVAEYYLVAYDRDGREFLTVGPVAFPTLPPEAEDLPHILDVEARNVDRAALGEAVERRLRADAARAVADGDAERVAHLLDVTYDLEAWAPVDVAAVRDRLDAALAEVAVDDGDGDGDGGDGTASRE
jgi:hypothetical protein